MKIKISLLKYRYRLIPVFLIIFSSMFLLAACNTNNTLLQQNQATNQDTNHGINADAETLTEADKVLSPEGYGAKGALADKELSIADMLMYAIQDEYLAHDEYVSIIEKFANQNPYTNIILSEETHISYLSEIYTAYDIELPNNTAAEHLIIPNNLLEAAQTGVQAEIDNIKMYESFLSYELPQDIYEIFLALKNGSEKHLQAFERQVDKLS